jgi:hypothetical protein
VKVKSTFKKMLLLHSEEEDLKGERFTGSFVKFYFFPLAVGTEVQGKGKQFPSPTLGSLLGL